MVRQAILGHEAQVGAVCVYAGAMISFAGSLAVSRLMTMSLPSPSC